MRINRDGQAKVIMQNSGSVHNFFAWPTVTKLQNGKIAVVASGFRLAHVCPFGKTVISYSENEGDSYTVPAPVIDTVLDDRDGGILSYGEKNVIVTSFNNTRRFQRRDFHKLVKKNLHDYCYGYLNGVTDAEEERDFGSTFKVSNDCGVTFSELYKSPVSSPHGPTKLSDGSVLWVGNKNSSRDAHEIEEHEVREKLALEENRVDAYKINDDGSCEFVGSIPEIIEEGKKLLSLEPYALGLDDGKVICHIRVQKEPAATTYFTIYQSESEDFGKTWTIPHKILSDKGGAPAHIMKHSSGILIGTYGYREAPYGIRAMFSSDNGKTWDTDYDVYVNGLNSDLGYPSTVELKDGSLITVFYARENENGPAVVMQQKWSFEV